jgi:hypothetical protein
MGKFGGFTHAVKQQNAPTLLFTTREKNAGTTQAKPLERVEAPDTSLRFSPIRLTRAMNQPLLEVCQPQQSPTVERFTQTARTHLLH